MKLVILAASGATGRELVRQALDRGHDVTAVVRDASRLSTTSARLSVAIANVHDAASIAGALGTGAVVLSGLGVTRGEPSGALSAGAHAIIAAKPAHIVWLGAFGSGASAPVAGFATRTLLSLMGARLRDKVQADQAIVAAGGSVFHAGPLSLGPLSPSRRTVSLLDAPQRLFPARVSRATVAAALLDEAESPHYAGAIALPLER